MVWPVPSQYALSTPYGKRGSHWSCNRNSQGQGIHTGADFAAPAGTPLYATIAGQIRWRNYGSAFGQHQFVISPDPGQPWAAGEVFYAHARKRLPDGTYVKPGDWVGEVGAEGNVTGPHLHYEFHPNTKNQWSCSVVADPAPTLEGTAMPQDIYNYEYSGKPAGSLALPVGKYVKLDFDTPDPAKGGLEFKMVYVNIKLTWPAAGGNGNVRVKYVRENGDATAYQDFAVTPAQPEFLLTHMHMEIGEKGMGGRWYVKVTGNMTSAVAGTRYAKYATVKDKG